LKKNENATFKFIKELYPGVDITHPYHIKEKIFDEEGVLVRNYILVDFYLKLGVDEFLIEYDGSQHHRITKKWGGKIGAKETLRRQKIRDKWLKQYCLDNKKILITIDGRKIRGKKIKSELKRQFKKLIKKTAKKKAAKKKNPREI